MTRVPGAHKIYLDDLTSGDTFYSPEHVVDSERIRVFAQQIDLQPFHLDEDAAGRTFFKGFVASGWHTAAITVKLLVASLAIAGGVIGTGSEIRWPRPTGPDDMLHVVSTVIDISPSTYRLDRGIVTV
ncbi:MaoC/PaaZ C-terminal domain-containing protein [Paraburkholderia sediminicola]|uniref:MaoC/PaaZ C-terminal domain-containing protein n=1 Tax=Paraburkholderia sediminicola TaxID=458836 RepID=UPI0038BC9E24